MNDLAILKQTAQTMSSREIAQLCQKPHDNVLKLIRSLIDGGIVKSTTPHQYMHPQNGQWYTEFLSDKRDSLVVVARLSPEFTAAVIDRWQELETQNNALALPNFTDPAAAAEAWAKEYREKQALAIENQTLKPKADAYDRFLDSDGLMTSGVIGKLLGYKSAQEFNDAIHAKGVAFKSSGVWQFYADFKDKHIGKMVGWEREEFNKAGVTLKWKTVAIDYFSSLLGRPVVQKELLDA
jgi:phage regulator Rha-like protein